MGGAGALDLDRHLLADAVEHPWKRVLEIPGERPAMVPAGKQIVEVFDEVSRALLVLGQPGAGKTTTMLQLADGLVGRAERDPGAPVPVVLNLSTWTVSRGSFLEWLIHELKARYYVPERMSRSWLAAHRLLLMLDGLDEVMAERRAECVTAINAFVEEWGVPGLLVCSRFDEYTALPVRLKLHGAVKLQPLTAEQVDRYLSADEHLSALHYAVREEPDLHELARNPLMLSVMATAYRDLPTGLLASDDLGGQSRITHIFDTYVGRMFERRSQAEQDFSREQTLSWLSWLAKNMGRHAQPVFLIEELQATWLATGPPRWIYVVASRLLGGVALGVVFGLMLDLTAGIFFGIDVRQLLDLAYGLWFGLLFGAVGGATVGVMEVARLARGGRLVATGVGDRWQPALDAVAYTLALGAAGGLLVGAIDGARSATFGIMLGSVFGLFFGLRSGGSTLDSDIRTVESLHWSWKAAWTGGRYGAGMGALVGLVAGVVLGAEEPGVAVILSLLLALLASLVGGLAGALFTGLRTGIVQGKTVPNQGMRLSLRNALLGGSIVGATGAAFLSSVSGLVWGLGTGLGPGVVGGVFLGLLAALWFGGLDIVQHGTLRIVLSQTSRVALDMARFLDHAVSLVFLQRVGGGYMFIHRRLQEHFEEFPREAGAAPPPGATTPTLTHSKGAL